MVFVLACLGAAGLNSAIVLAAQGRLLHIRVTGELTEDHRAGVELGIAEASQTAQLLGATISSSPDLTRATIGMINGGETVSHSLLPFIHLTAAGRGPFEKHCAFRMEETKDAPAWDSTSTRFGASELNERFARRFGRPMTSAAWNGWFAVKALVETALRNDDTAKLCEAMSRGRFDGHKGVPLSFHPETRVLGAAMTKQ